MAPSVKIAVALLLTLSLPLAAQSSAKIAPADPAIAKLEQGIPQWMEAAGIPGVSIALIRNGKTVWLHSFGEAVKDPARPVTVTSLFNVGSLSKPVFAYAVLKLVDQGKLGLDVPLTHYLPEPYITGDPRLEKITARIVLSHRTGFPNWRAEGSPLTINFTPGERFSYSGEGMVYLQKAVEAITHQPIEEVMREQVFIPLGMTESSYIWRESWASNVTKGYDPDGTPHDMFHSDKGNVAGSLGTTTRDYAIFLEAILNGKGLKPATLREMETPQIAVDPTCTNCTGHAPSKLSEDIFWGLGWGIEKNASGKYLWHWGDNGIYKAYVSVDLERRSAVVFFANSSNGLAIAPAIVHAALGGEHPAFNWVKYDTYDSTAMRFSQYSIHHTAAETMQEFAPLIADGTIPESAINAYGYRLLGKKQFADAITILSRNVELHPTSFNTYDSLGEAYMTAGNKPLATQNYEKELALDPGNNNATEALKKLQAH
jgi:CubicO group peptidase (beta-lactamase class C family)